jgi:hypothetical protein
MVSSYQNFMSEKKKHVMGMAPYMILLLFF